MQEIIYLDNAATTWPKPPSVLRRVNRCFKEACGNPGRSAHLLSMRAAEEVYHARCALNRFFGGNAEQNVIFFPNATASLNTVIRGVLSAGDHVITSNIIPCCVRCMHFGAMESHMTLWMWLVRRIRK